MKTLIENLCGNLKKLCCDLGLDPATLTKSIIIFIILIGIIALMVKYPIIFVILAVLLLSILIIMAIYSMLEP